MGELIDGLKTALPGLFASDDYRSQLRAVDEEAKEQQEQAFENLRKRAEAENIAIMRTPMGFALAPTQDGNVIQPDVFSAMRDVDKQHIEGIIAELQGGLERVMREMPAIDKKRRDRIRKVNEDLASATISASVAVLRQRFADHKLSVLVKKLFRPISGHPRPLERNRNRPCAQGRTFSAGGDARTGGSRAALRGRGAG